MNINDAFKKLNLNEEEDMYDLKKLKKHYHFLALKYHPDKNNDINSKKEFQEINEAYKIIFKLYEDNNINVNEINNNKNKKTKFKYSNEDEYENKDENKDEKYISFEELFEDFVGLLNIKSNEEIDMIKKYFMQKYNYYNGLILKKLSNSKYFNNLINIFNNIDENYEKILIINTEIDNVLNNEIYKLELDDETLFIPLWYKEVIYKGYLIKIKIINLDSKIVIDNDNNIYINIERNLTDILDNNISINIGSKNYEISNNLLYMKKNCSYILENCGIINPYCDISDIDKNKNYKSNIIINLTLI